jgi:hypothetical protein
LGVEHLVNHGPGFRDYLITRGLITALVRLLLPAKPTVLLEKIISLMSKMIRTNEVPPCKDAVRNLMTALRGIVSHPNANVVRDAELEIERMGGIYPGKFA